LRSLVCLFHSARPFLAVAAVVDLAAACPQIAFAHACVSLMAVVKWLHGSPEFQPKVSTEDAQQILPAFNRCCCGPVYRSASFALVHATVHATRGM
jgi:hypothetical protein